jgi:hypothetical protein
MISTSDSGARAQLHAARGQVRRTPTRSHFIPGPIWRSRPPLAHYDPSIKDLTRESTFNFPQEGSDPASDKDDQDLASLARNEKHRPTRAGNLAVELPGIFD